MKSTCTKSAVDAHNATIQAAIDYIDAQRVRAVQAGDPVDGRTTVLIAALHNCLEPAPVAVRSDQLQ